MVFLSSQHLCSMFMYSVWSDNLGIVIIEWHININETHYIYILNHETGLKFLHFILICFQHKFYGGNFDIKNGKFHKFKTKEFE